MVQECPACHAGQGHAFAVSSAPLGTIVIVYRCDACHREWRAVRHQPEYAWLVPPTMENDSDDWRGGR
jgi:hypothetical protein